LLVGCALTIPRLGKVDEPQRPETHLATALAILVQQHPAPGAALGDLQIKPIAVGIEAGRAGFLDVAPRQPLDQTRHASSPKKSRRFGACGSHVSLRSALP